MRLLHPTLITPLVHLAGPRRSLLLPTCLYRLYSSQSPLIVQYDFDAPSTGRIRMLALNRPQTRNAISKQLLHELRSHIDSIAAEYATDGSEVPVDKISSEDRVGSAVIGDSDGPTRALILASLVDSSFCSGADLKERATFDRDETATFLGNLRSTFTALSKLPIPTICAISSKALGGGLELALCTHFRVIASTAQVGLPETRIGIIPGAGGTYRLPALVGPARARDLILTGRLVSGGDAFFLGLSDRYVEVESKQGETKEEELARAGEMTRLAAMGLAQEICQGGPVANRAALEAVGWAREEVENRCYERVVGTDDRNEALKAFKEKRKPIFKGR